MKTTSLFSSLRLASFVVLFAVSAVISACGGGGGGSSGDPADVGMDQAPGNVQQFAALFNAARAQARSCGAIQAPAAAPLTKWNPKLQQAAQGHADDMNAKNYFSHDGADGSTGVDRAARAGYTGTPVGENLAKGSTDPGTLTSMWLESQGHCGAIMNGEAKTLAVAQSGPYTVMMTGN